MSLNPYLLFNGGCGKIETMMPHAGTPHDCRGRHPDGFRRPARAL